MGAEYRMLVDNEWVKAQSGASFTTNNPYTGRR